MVRTLFWVLLFVAFSSDAFAQNDFETLLKEGAVLFERGQYEDALEKYSAAQAIYDHPRLQLQIGRTLENLNRCSEANTAFQNVVESEQAEEFDKERAKVRQQRLAETCKELPEENPVETPKETEVIEAPPEQKESGSIVLPVVGTSLVVLGAVGVTVGFVATSTDGDEIDKSWLMIADKYGCEYNADSDALTNCSVEGVEQTDDYQNLSDEISMSNTRRAIVFATGGVLFAAGTGILLYHYVFADDGPNNATLAPEFGPDYAGANLHLRF